VKGFELEEQLQGMARELPEVFGLFEVELSEPEEVERILAEAREAMLMASLESAEEARQKEEQAQQMARRILELTREAERDGLTQLMNRASFEKALEGVFAEARNAGASLAVVFCDLDHFKKINDTYGHLAGDEVLRAFAGLLGRMSRSGDVAARYGGEEFVLLLRGVGAEEAEVVSQRIRESLAAGPIDLGNDQEAPVTVSIGYAVQTPSGPFKRAGELIAAADANLYLAKSRGRNRVVG
jgi:diguanylate cyclase (GGDEF)-like protein